MTRASPRVLAICLDGYEDSLGRRLMADGQLPALSRIQSDSASYLLDYEEAKHTGLAGEHFSTGLAPEAAQRWGTSHFDSRTYDVWQEGTQLVPFPARLPVKTVVFDTTYFDLKRAPDVTGIVDWGAHDPGTLPRSHPGSLLNECNARFGAYPASGWLYAVPWQSAAACEEMGRALSRALQVRADAAQWLLRDRLPDWDLGVVWLSELHSGNEGLWHGIDPAHPLHGAESAVAAEKALIDVHRGVDALVDQLTTAFGDASVVLFTLGGMGPNRSDVPSMALLPELLFRDHFGRPLMRVPETWRSDPQGLPRLDAGRWDDAVANLVGPPPRRPLTRELVRLARGLQRRMGLQRGGPRRLSFDWIPAMRYRGFWPEMRAFALPSFYDGQVRLNLIGRESRGVVSLSEYTAELGRIEELVRECRDLSTGQPMVEAVDRPAESRPLELGFSQADMTIRWRGVSNGFEHPRLGRFGPLPFRRTGGHTGRHGLALVMSDRQPAGEQGWASAFDVVPTLIDLLGLPPLSELSGSSLLRRAQAPPVEHTPQLL